MQPQCRLGTDWNSGSLGCRLQSVRSTDCLPGCLPFQRAVQSQGEKGAMQSEEADISSAPSSTAPHLTTARPPPPPEPPPPWKSYTGKWNPVTYPSRHTHTHPPPPTPHTHTHQALHTILLMHIPGRGSVINSPHVLLLPNQAAGINYLTFYPFPNSTICSSKQYLESRLPGTNIFVCYY